MKLDLNKLRQVCVFCDPASHGQANQILLRSDNFYVFAGLGAILEGYLIISTKTCKASGGEGTSLSELSLELLDELVYLRSLVSAFYVEIYGHSGLSFEHGRVGSCIRSTEETKHCFHPHLCCYPGVVHQGTGYQDRYGKIKYLWDSFALPNRRICNGLHTLHANVGSLPYLYVEHHLDNEITRASVINIESQAFIVPDEDALASQFLRRHFSDLVQDQKKWDWATFPTMNRVHQVIAKFSHWLQEHQNDYAVAFSPGQPPQICFRKSASRLTQYAYEKISDRFKARWQDVLQYNTVGRFLAQIPSGASGGTDEAIRVLDIGCGPGLYTKVFADLGFECVAVDYSGQMLQEAEHYLAESLSAGNITLVLARVKNLTSTIQGIFDAIWLSAVLLHVPRCEALKTLKTLKTFLSEQGVLYISTRLLCTEDGHDFPALEVRQEGRVFVYYQKNELEKLFAAAKLKIVQSWQGTTTLGTLGEKRSKPWCHYLLRKCEK